MKIATIRFGELDIDQSKIITMPDGILGFSDKLFTMITPEGQSPFCWFQSLDNPALAFVLVDARQMFPEYTFALTSEENERLMLADRSEIVVLLVVTLSPDPRKITANLQGPIVLNPERMIAKQIVLEGSKFLTRQPLFAQDAGESGAACNAGGLQHSCVTSC